MSADWVELDQMFSDNVVNYMEPLYGPHFENVLYVHLEDNTTKAFDQLSQYRLNKIFLDFTVDGYFKKVRKKIRKNKNLPIIGLCPNSFIQLKSRHIDNNSDVANAFVNFRKIEKLTTAYEIDCKDSEYHECTDILFENGDTLRVLATKKTVRKNIADGQKILDSLSLKARSMITGKVEK